MKTLVLLFLMMSTLAFGQSPLACTMGGGVNRPVRFEGITEMLSDIVVICTGGTPTPAVTPVPTVNIQVILNTTLTSRCMVAGNTGCIGSYSEALLLLDEPAPAAQYGCPTATCINAGNGTGAAIYGNGVQTTPSPMNVNANRNVFQGFQTATNTVTFIGVPIDPPGDGKQRIVRITNVRANVNLLGISSGNAAPPPVTAFITSTPSSSMPINGMAIQAVGSVQRSMSASLLGSPTFEWKTAQNEALAVDPASSGISQFALRFRELFSTAFEKRNTATIAADPTALADQNDLAGPPYHSETGFLNSSLNLPASTVQGNRVGTPDAGARLMAHFTGVPPGVLLFSQVSATVTGGGPGVVRMVNTDAIGGGFYSQAAGNAFGIAPIPVVGGSATAVYEVLESDPNSLATVDIPIYVAYSSRPALGTTTVNLSYAPVSTQGVAVTPNVPRFADTSAPMNVFVIQPNLCASPATTGAQFDASGGPGSIAVTTLSNCTWWPYSNDPWITVPTGVRTGAGTLSYTVAPNPSPAYRTGIVFLEARTPSSPVEYLTVTQAGVPCSYSVGPSPGVFTSDGGSGTISVTANYPFCSWTAVSHDAWIKVISGTPGFGDGTVVISVASSLNPRTGTLDIAGQTVTVQQLGAIVNMPAPVSVTPTNGGGIQSTITYTFTDKDGWQDISIANMLINDFLDGRHACYIAFIPSGPASGTVYLVDDAGNAGGPFQSLTIPMTDNKNIVANGNCAIGTEGSYVQTNGDTLTVALATYFQPTWAGNRIIHLAARDAALHNSGWHAMGLFSPWRIGGPIPSGPAARDVSPGRSTSASENYTFTFTHSNGFADLTVLNVLVNRFLDGRNACYVAFRPTGPSTGEVLLVNDNGDAGGPFQSLLIPGTGTIHNSQCTISATGSSVSGSGNTLSLTLPITFSPGFTGSKVIYTAGRTDTQSSGWQALGTVTLP